MTMRVPTTSEEENTINYLKTIGLLTEIPPSTLLGGPQYRFVQPERAGQTGHTKRAIQAAQLLGQAGPAGQGGQWGQAGYNPNNPPQYKSVQVGEVLPKPEKPFGMEFWAKPPPPDEENPELLLPNNNTQPSFMGTKPKISLADALWPEEKAKQQRQNPKISLAEAIWGEPEEKAKQQRQDPKISLAEAIWGEPEQVKKEGGEKNNNQNTR